MPDKLPFAEDIKAYWKTSSTSPDTWLEKAKREIQKVKGKVVTEAYGVENDRAVFMLVFEVGADRFKIHWPVLPSRKGETIAPKIQAATMLYHDVKARCLSAQVIGFRAAFHASLMLPDGRTAGQLTSTELNNLPQLLDGRR